MSRATHRERRSTGRRDAGGSVGARRKNSDAFEPIRQRRYAFLPRSCSTAVYAERAG